MTWNIQRKEFLAQLENRLNLSLSTNDRELRNKFFDNYIVIKGRHFLCGLEGLKNILNKESHELLTYILLTATRCIEDPSSENITALKSQYHLLQQLLNENKTYNKVTVGANLFFNSIFTVSGFIACMTGFMFMNEALAGIAGVTAGAMLLSIGPWGLLALGLGLAILGTAIAVISATEAIEDARFLGDKQAKEIDEFVSFLDKPNAALDQEMPEINHLSLGSQ
ncbi:hypothetical protein ACQUW5_01005 [Legionella sp. CNM-1927-20]|uniref:hypothetical protein n=1 Tax=Legionella sp. CNM-1927-20 TaxID=3422221 RepID=UPI00403B3042